LPAVLLEAGSVLLDFLVLCVLWVEDLWCLVVVVADVDADAGAADVSWASTEPERATPATSREAIASLRIMIMSLEILVATDPAGTRLSRAA
jgi:hypothetical protein